MSSKFRGGSGNVRAREREDDAAFGIEAQCKGDCLIEVRSGPIGTIDLVLHVTNGKLGFKHQIGIDGQAARPKPFAAIGNGYAWLERIA